MKRICAALLMVALMAGAAWGAETAITDTKIKINKMDLTEVGYGKESRLICFDMKSNIPDGLGIVVTLDNGVDVTSVAASEATAGLIKSKNGLFSGCFYDLLDSGIEAGEFTLRMDMAFSKDNAKHSGYEQLNGRFISIDGNKRKRFHQETRMNLPAVAKAEKIPDDDEELFAYDVIIISAKDEDADSQKVREMLMGLEKRISQVQILGEASGKVNVERKSSIFICDHIFQQAQYPKLKEYKEDVRTLYKALLKIKQTDEFYKVGMGAPNAKKWRALRERLAKKYEGIKLPFGHGDAFTDLDTLAGCFALARVRPASAVFDFNRDEDIIFTLRKRVEDTSQLLLDD